MYMYTVGYGTMEDSGDVTLLHDKEFSSQDFEAMVIESTVETVKREVNKGEECYLHAFDQLYDHVANVMCEKFGFVKAQYKARFSCFGWPSLFDPTDWGGQRDEELNKITAALNKAGFDRSFDSHFQMQDRWRKETDELMKKEQEQDKSDPPPTV